MISEKELQSVMILCSNDNNDIKYNAQVILQTVLKDNINANLKYYSEEEFKCGLTNQSLFTSDSVINIKYLNNGRLDVLERMAQVLLEGILREVGNRAFKVLAVQLVNKTTDFNQVGWIVNASLDVSDEEFSTKQNLERTIKLWYGNKTREKNHG